MAVAVERAGGRATKEAERHVPGEVGVWVFIFSEMIVFAVLFFTFLDSRAKDPELFETSRRTLHQTNGVILTVLLLTGSVLVAMAVGAVRRAQLRQAEKLIIGAVTCGVAFAVLKVFEYRDKISHDLTPKTNDFFTWYYVLTGLHWFHLTIGLTILLLMLRHVRKPALSVRQFRFVEGGACYWHMVDLLWIVLFPLLYLVR